MSGWDEGMVKNEEEMGIVRYRNKTRQKKEK
jgi:hypothetical protein